MSDACNEIQSHLFQLQDLNYRDFSSKLMPTISKDTVIGVRTPMLRNYAKELRGTPMAAEFMAQLPHGYYEENNLHAFLIEQIRDFDTAMAEVERFLPYVDNWATCDSMSPKAFARHRSELLAHCKLWLNSERTYTVRFGIGMLMRHFLDDAFLTEYPELVAGISSEEYYINMMIAWYFATALAKQYGAILPYLTEHRLSPWVHNKTIQKAVESYRITPEQKDFLKTLRIKGSKESQK